MVDKEIASVDRLGHKDLEMEKLRHWRLYIRNQMYSSNIFSFNHRCIQSLQNSISISIYI